MTENNETAAHTRSLPLLEVKDLQVEFDTKAGQAKAINGLNFTLRAGETLAILGESGSGKSVTAQTIMGILDMPPGKITGGEIRYRGEDMLQMSDEQRRKLRGVDISMIFQDALSSLNPVINVGWQIGEMFRVHQGMGRRESREKAIELMKRVGIPAAEKRVDDFPHQFSGGMRQRIMIAMAIALDPDVLIADEPTTALDVTVQAQVMRLLKELQVANNMGLILITHDLGVVADVADKIAVMYSGRVMEYADVYDIYANPGHPYTKGLLDSLPRIDSEDDRLHSIKGLPPSLTEMPSGCPFSPRCPYATDLCRTDRPELVELSVGHESACHYREELSAGTLEPTVQDAPAAAHPDDTPPEAADLSNDPFADSEVVLDVKNLVKHFPVKEGIIFKKQTGAVQAVDDVSFQLRKGETIGIVGESGCGKSTLAKLLMRLEEPDSGEVLFKGEDFLSLKGDALRKARRKIQIIFQDPYTSLNPRMSVGDIIAEPFKLHPDAVPPQGVRERVKELLAVVGLSPDHINRYPHQFSGGQRQRIGIARGLALNPDVIICDEPVSALDVSVQAQVMNLLDDLQEEFGLSYIFIAHDLSIVRHISDRVGVMYLGKLAELGDDQEIYGAPAHPYTQALLSAVPVPDPTMRAERQEIILKGDPPNPANPPSGCRFRTRCWKATDICTTQLPLLEVRPGITQEAACHHAAQNEEVTALEQ